MSKIVLPAKCCQLRLKWQQFLSHLVLGYENDLFFKMVLQRSRYAKMILLLTVLSKYVGVVGQVLLAESSAVNSKMKQWLEY